MEIENGDDKFESKLNEASRRKAKDELNELNDKDRAIAVQTLRKWIKEQNWLRSPTDFRFLLRFLRAKKFSQLEARKCIENYWTEKSSCAAWYKNVDPTDKTLQKIIKTGFFISPKVYDKHGRRLVIIRLGKMDLNILTKEWGIANMFKAVLMVYDWLAVDEHVQVHGLSFIMDYTDVTLPFMMATSGPDISKRFMRFFQNSLPARVKSCHLYNEPAFVDVLLQMIHPFMKQKLKDRMYMHGKSLVKIYDDLGMSVLIDEYLPDDYTGPSVGSTDQATEYMISEMTKPEFRDYMKQISSGKYGVDVEKRKACDAPAESFRKLNVD